MLVIFPHISDIIVCVVNVGQTYFYRRIKMTYNLLGRTYSPDDIIPKNTAMRMVGLKKSAFDQAVKKHNIERQKIGRSQQGKCMFFVHDIMTLRQLMFG